MYFTFPFEDFEPALGGIDGVHGWRDRQGTLVVYMHNDVSGKIRTVLEAEGFSGKLECVLEEHPHLLMPDFDEMDQDS